MGKRKISIILTLLMIFLSACGTLDNAKTSTIHIDEKGKVSSITIEDFPTEQYSEEDLKQSVDQAIKDYNDKQGAEKVVLVRLQVKKEQAHLTMEYATSADYEAFNGRTLFIGTVAEAIAAGYDFKTEFTCIDEVSVEGQTITKEEGDAQVIITNEPVQIKTIKDILYTSNNAKVVDKRLAQVEASEEATENGITFGNSECAYIIYRLKTNEEK